MRLPHHIRISLWKRKMSFLQSLFSWVLFLLIFILSSFESAASPKEKNGQVSHKKTTLTKTIAHNGIQRTYHIYFPEDFSREKKHPLVFALHGGGGSGLRFDEVVTRGTLRIAADKHNVVLVFPDGVNKTWCDGRTEIIKNKQSYDDVGFISEIIDSMVKNYGIDSTRIYATGISNGGFMSLRLALEASERFAAVAAVAAQLSDALKDKQPQNPISIMLVNGTQDPLVPFNGGHVRVTKWGRSRGKILSTLETVEHFHQSNDCTHLAETFTLADKEPEDGTRVELKKYSGGKDNAEVVLVTIIGGGHTWPGGMQYFSPQRVGKLCKDINASEMILAFFMEHSKK